MSRTAAFFVLVAVSGVLVAAPAEDEPAPPPAPPSISGRVLLKGKRPAPATVEIKEKACDGAHEKPPADEATLVSEDGAIPNVLVYVKAGLEGRTFEPPKEPKTLRQEGCLFVPHVVALQVGEPLRITNGDPTSHNVNAVAAVCTPWQNQSVQKGQEVLWTPDAEEFEPPIRVRCDLHSWMKAHVAVLPHPFHAVTGADGRFSLAGLPPGKYGIAVWHETFGTVSADVELGEKDAKTIEIMLEAPAAPE